jgi:hypothetical protein
VRGLGDFVLGVEWAMMRQRWECRIVILAAMGSDGHDFGNAGVEIGKDKASDGHLNFVLVTYVSDFWERSEQKSGFGC